VRVQYLGPRTTRTDFNNAAVESYNKATGTATDRPDIPAMALLRLIESEAAECFLGFPEKLAVRLNGLAPELLDGAFDKHRRALPPLVPPAQPFLERPDTVGASAEADSHSLLHSVH